MEEYCFCLNVQQCYNKKSRYITEQEASGLLSKLGNKDPLNKIPLWGDILFWGNTAEF